MSEELVYFAAFANDWSQPTLQGRLTALVSTIARAGWSSVWLEVVSPAERARAHVGSVVFGDAVVHGAFFAALDRFATGDGAFVIPQAARADLGALVQSGSGDIVVVPLGARSQSLGALVVVGSANVERVHALRVFGEIIALAIESDGRARRAEGDAERAAVISHVGESIRSSLDREEILRAVARDVRVAFDAARCAIYVRDDRRPNLASVIAADDPGIIATDLPDRIPIAGTLLNRCLGLGQVVRVERGANAVDQAQLLPFGATAMLLVPFVVGGRIDAGLSIQYAVERSFDERELQLMRTLAMHVGLSLANSRLFEGERIARRRAEDIERNVRALKETRGVVEILQLLLDMISREYDLSGSAWAIDNGHLKCCVVAARAGRAGPTIDDVSDGALAVVEAMRGLDVVPIAARSDGAWASIVGTGGGFALPLRVDGRLLGMLVFDGVVREGADDREAFMRTVAAHGALALANASAFEAQERFAQENAAISEAGRAILGHNDPASLGDAMCQYAYDMSHADYVSLYVPRDGALRRIGSASYDDVSPLPIVLGGDDTDMNAALVRIESTQLRGAGVATVMVPLRSGPDSPLTGVFVCSRRGDDEFSASTIRLLETLGALVALGLRNADLYQALSENNEFKDDLLAMFTHDFKGPLTVIQGYTELLLEDDLGVHRSSIETIYAQSKRLAKLAEDALVLARTQAAGFSLQRNLCDLNEFVGESVQAHDPAETRIDYRFPQEQTLVWIDRTRLKHVVDNVIANALKYSSGLVTVSVGATDSQAIMRFSDTGIGIPEADLERIFARFGRGTNARARGISGTGVGLYVARKIVDVHGGQINVTSQEDRGSSFEIVLPLAPAVVVAAELALSAQ